LSVKETARIIGKDRSTVSNALRLLNLPEGVIELLEQGRLTAGHARAILAIEGEEDQLEWAERTVSRGYTVREIEEAAPARKRGKRKERRVDPQLAAIEERAELRFGTRVRISPRRKGGVISIEYYTEEELEAILEKMGVDTQL
jgi:ParB family chromosome partitioning protein